MHGENTALGKPLCRYDRDVVGAAFSSWPLQSGKVYYLLGLGITMRSGVRRYRRIIRKANTHVIQLPSHVPRRTSMKRNTCTLHRHADNEKQYTGYLHRFIEPTSAAPAAPARCNTRLVCAQTAKVAPIKTRSDDSLGFRLGLVFAQVDRLRGLAPAYSLDGT